MKAARLHRYDENIPQDSLTVEEIEEPKIEGPPDVIVRIGAAGLCRTDIHIIEGQWAPIQDPDRTLLPYTLGHENAGWVEEVGAGVTNVEIGDTVILHPLMTCGLCRAEARLLGQASFTATRLFEDLTLHPLSRARPILLVTWRNQVPYRGSLNIEVDQVPVFSGADRLTTAQM